VRLAHRSLQLRGGGLAAGSALAAAPARILPGLPPPPLTTPRSTPACLLADERPNTPDCVSACLPSCNQADAARSSVCMPWVRGCLSVRVSPAGAHGRVGGGRARDRPARDLGA
jgi:hypothetical protein